MKTIFTLLICIIILIPDYGHGQSYSNDGKFVIVLDIQQGYVNHIKSDNSVVNFINAVNRVIENTDTNNILYVVTLHKALTISFKGITIDTLAYLDVDDRVNCVNNKIMSKEGGNAFSVDSLITKLKQNNVNEVIVIGMLASKCVYNTLVGGIELGYEMYVIPEAILGKSEKRKTKSLRKLADNGIKEISLEDYCNHIN